MENDAWRVALNIMHGVQTPSSAANPGMPAIPKAVVYTNAYHLMATREIFLALLRSYGVSLAEPACWRCWSVGCVWDSHGEGCW